MDPPNNPHNVGSGLPGFPHREQRLAAVVSGSPSRDELGSVRLTRLLAIRRAPGASGPVVDRVCGVPGLDSRKPINLAL